jgi:hypothetical protein
LPRVIDDKESAFVRMMLWRRTNAFLSIFWEETDKVPIASKPIRNVLNIVYVEVLKTTSYTYSTGPD